jgi:hypothetical protein
MGWSNPFRRGVVRRNHAPASNESDVPWTLLIAVVVLCFVLVIALPVMGVMYMDMNNALHRAAEETRKMKELRIKIVRELRGEE